MRCYKNLYFQISLSCLCIILSGCAATDRISNIGKAPEMSAIQDPTVQPGYQPISMPMPAPQNIERQKNSLWQSDRVTFFKDQRATNVGDILTVLINIKDEATIDNKTTRTRASEEGASLPAMLGYETALNRVLPQDVDNTNLAELDSNSSHKGTGKIDRTDEIKLRMAALITQVLPNGNMAIQGKQEVLVNFEKRILNVTGVIRPQDISVQNTVNYDQIAEARIIYGGQGQITDVQQPRYGQQLYDVIFPF